MLRPFLVLVLCLASASSSQWAKLGNPAELKCTEPGVTINQCTWKTPTSESAQLILEEGRKITFSDHECTVSINNVEEKDEGTWECHMSYISNNTGTHDIKEKTLNIAKFPTGGPIIEASKVGGNDTETNYTCIFESEPPADFTWSIVENNETISDEQTVTLQNDEFTNSTLKCTVNFDQDYGLTDTFNATVFRDDGGSVKPDDKPDAPSHAGTKTILVVLAVIVIVVLIVGCLVLRGCVKNPCKSADSVEKVDNAGDKQEENAAMDKTDSKNDSTTVSLDTEKADCNGDNETEKADSIKDEKADSTKEEKADGGNKLIAFVTKLFKPRSDVVADKNVIDEEDGDQDQNDSKIVLTTFNVETETEKPECDQIEETDVTKSKKAESGNKLIAVFAKMFKPRSDVVADKTVPDEENLVKESDEDEEKDNEKEPLTNELEPKDKPELEPEDKPELEPEDKAEPIEEEDSNKKEPTPNTSF